MTLTLALCLLQGALANEDPGPPTTETALKYVRDSAEYHAITTMVYRMATEQLQEVKKGARPWAVVLDVDETVLDNSTYQLERRAYGFHYESVSWLAWCERRQAGTVPGVKAFIDAVRDAGGEVAYVTNRKVAVTDATRDNLDDHGLWKKGDVLCLRTDTSDKAPRRESLRTGDGDCSFGKPTRIAMYIGDTMGDFPADGESASTRLELLGERAFLLPNPMYGEWQSRGGITRPQP
jgi:5'-nucleotidase (lipoprotein e(P4) family)